MGRTMGILVVLAAFAVGTAWAAEPPEARIARELAELLIAGRAVVAQNQPLINDATKGDKGFGPDVFGRAVKAEFKSKTGIDLDALGTSSRRDRLLRALFDAQRAVVADAQPILNLPGMGFKGFTPAVFGLRTGEKFAAATGVSLKQTSDQYRNPVNKPDAFEQRVLARFADARWERGKGHSEVTVEGGRKVLRHLQPLYVARSCLPCHGDPKGELDVAGRAKEGYREGEVRGAVSVTVPLAR